MFLIRLTVVAVLLLAAGISWYLAPLEPGILVLQFAFTPRTFATIIHAWPNEHLARYRAHLPFDYLLLLAYGAMGYLISTRTTLFSRAGPLLRWSATWSLPLAAVLDGVENALHWWLTATPRFGIVLPYALSASCASLKWLLLFVFGILMIYAVAKAEQE